jgi:multicomponent K+:H+ antiporter subunit D
VSSGLLLASLGLGIEEITAPALFYLSASVLTTSAFFMLTGMTDRTRLPSSALVSDEPPIATTPAVASPAPARVTAETPSYVAFGVEEPDPYGTAEDVGAAIPAAMAFLGLMFVCCVLLVTGMPPLPGFIAKFTLLAAALGAAPAAGVSVQAWALTIVVLATGFAAVIALTRIGIRLFWAGERRTPRLRVLEAAPVAFLVMLCLVLSAFSGPAMTFFEATARSLHDPQTYIRTVLAAQAELQSEAREP